MVTSIKKLLNFFYFSSLNVVLASIICSIAFFKLPSGKHSFDVKTISQLFCACWAIYILDRLLDNIGDEEPKTLRHIFHKTYQYNFQILFIALLFIGLSISFFQPLKITLFGFGVITLIGIYFLLLSKTKNFKFYKELFMPIIYLITIIGLPFYLSSSINLSSWFLAFMFFGVVIQNTLAFSLFEQYDNESIENICKKISSIWVRRIINYIGSVNLFMVIFFFSNDLQYSNLLSFIFLAISISTSLIIANPTIFKKNYRWIIDGLLFLPIFIF